MRCLTTKEIFRVLFKQKTIRFIGSLCWDFTSGGQPTAYMPYPVASISGGYLKNNEDSLAMQLYSSFAADLVLINNKGEHVAALAFKQKKPDMWIRNDISESYQQAIATMFAVIISIKDYLRQYTFYTTEIRLFHHYKSAFQRTNVLGLQRLL